MKKAVLALCATALLGGCATLPHGEARTFTAHDAAIFMPDGKPFVARGINLQYGDNPHAARPAIRAIARTGANMVRVELRRDTSAGQVRKLLDSAVRHRLPVMLMYWEQDITCGTDANILKRDVHDLWLTRWAPVLKTPKYQPWIMLNIANEWGSARDNYSEYVDTYTGLIGELRQAGYRFPIVIDAGECGQRTESFLDGRGQRLVDADPLRNVILSVHAYNEPWNRPALIDRHISDLRATGLPFMLGEFGDRELVEDGNAVDHIYLMQSATAQGIGWLAWSWKGNGGATQVLDMSKRYGRADLTRRGRDVVSAMRKHP